MLAVVDEEQQRLRPQIVDDGLPQRTSGAIADPEATGDGLHDQVGIADRRQLDQPHAVRLLTDELGRGLDHQPRLSGAAGADHRDQPMRPSECLELRQLPLASDEGGQLRRKVGAAALHGPERGKLHIQAIDDQLEHAFGNGQVLEPMRPEVADRHAVRQVAADEGVHRLGEEHLSAGAGRGDARSTVNVEADVAAGSEAGLAGVQTHAHPDAMAVRPRLACQGALSVGGCRDRIRGACEDDEEGVTLRPDLNPRLECIAQERLMRLEHVTVSGPELLHEPGGPLDVREQEGNRPFR